MSIFPDSKLPSMPQATYLWSPSTISSEIWNSTGLLLFNAPYCNSAMPKRQQSNNSQRTSFRSRTFTWHSQLLHYICQNSSISRTPWRETRKIRDIETLLTSKDACCNQYGNPETGRDNADRISNTWWHPLANHRNSANLRCWFSPPSTSNIFTPR